MKLFSAAFLASGALASDRTFADKPDFMLAVSEGWNPTWAANKMRMIEDNTALYFDTYVPSDNNKGQRVAKIMSEFLAGTRVGAKKLSQKCNDGRRKRSVNDDDTRYNVPVNNPQHAMFQLFYQHAEWVRNEIFTSDKRNCKKQALRLFKRLDRHQQYWAWQFCSKIDATPQFCEWAYFKKNGETKGHPRKGTYVSDKYGRDVDTAYTAVGCEHARDGDDHAKLICPTGYIKIIEAKYGRFGKGICSASGHAGIQKPCDKYVDVKQYASDTCAGQTECNLRVTNKISGEIFPRQDPCHGVPKYVQVKFECTEEKPANPDDGYTVGCEHAATNEEKYADLSCPAGKTIEITSAEYGRWSTKTCNYHNASNKQCNQYVDVYENAKEKCNGNQSCSYRAANKVTGIVYPRQDPCHGVAKYTRVKFNCV